MTTTRAPFDPRPALVLLLVPLLAFGESTAYYSARAVIVPHWMNTLIVPTETIFEAYGWSTPALAVGTVLAAGLGALIGGWGTLALGFVVLAAGIGLMPLTSEDFLAPPLIVAGLGRGMIAIGVLSVLADAFRGRRAWLLATGFALFYGAVNLSSLGASWSAGFVSGTSSAIPVFQGAALLAAIGFFLAAGAGAAWLLLGRRYPEPDPRRRRLVAGPHLAGALLAVVGVPLLILLFAGFEPITALLAASQGFGGGQMMWAINPVVTTLACGLIALVTLALHFLGIAVRPLAVAGVGGLVAAVALAIALGVSWPVAGAASTQILVGFGLMGVGEAVLQAFLFTGWGRDLHWRLTAPMAGLWRAPTLLAGTATALVPWVDPVDGVSAFAWALVPALGLFAVLVGVAGFVLPRSWRAAPDAQPAETPA